MKARKVILLAIVVIMLIAAGWLFFSQPSAGPDGLRIVVTSWPAEVLARPVVGERANLFNLMASQVDPHNFTVTPEAVIRVAEANLLIKNGAGLEPWLDNLLAAADNPDLQILDLSEGIKRLMDRRYLFEVTDQNTCRRQGGQWQECGPNQCQLLGGEICPQVCGPAICSVAEEDPHLWLDPIIASKQVTAIGEKLSQVTGDEQFRSNAEQYAEQLLALAQTIHDQLKNFQRRGFVAQHPAFTFFADRFKLIQLAVFEPTPGEEPTVRDLERLANLINTQKIKVIFTEPPEPKPEVANFAHEFGLQLLPLDPMETGVYKLNYYQEVMLENAANFRAALEELNK